MFRMILLVLLFLPALVGCAKELKSDVINLPTAPELKMRDVEWKAMSDNDKVYMCLDVPNYRNLSLNTQDIQLFMIYQNKVIKYNGYGNCKSDSININKIK